MDIKEWCAFCLLLFDIFKDLRKIFIFSMDNGRGIADPTTIYVIVGLKEYKITNLLMTLELLEIN